MADASTENSSETPAAAVGPCDAETARLIAQLRRERDDAVFRREMSLTTLRAIWCEAVQHPGDEWSRVVAVCRDELDGARCEKEKIT